MNLPLESDCEIGTNEASTPQMDGGGVSSSDNRIDKLIAVARRYEVATRLIKAADIDNNIEVFILNWLTDQLELELLQIAEG